MKFLFVLIGTVVLSRGKQDATIDRSIFIGRR